MAVNKAVYGMLKYEKALGNAISNTLCKRGIQHLHIKEAPYSWFSLKHFLYRSESSRDSRVESSRSGEIFKNCI